MFVKSVHAIKHVAKKKQNELTMKAKLTYDSEFGPIRSPVYEVGELLQITC